MPDIVTRDSDAIQWELPKRVTAKKAGEVVCHFLDTASTSFGRATHYNTRQEQQKAELAAHQAMMKFDRDLYALFLVLPGVMERAVQIGTKNLLGTPRNGQAKGLMDARMEREVLYYYMKQMPPQMIFKLFQAFRVGTEETPKANNARTRKLILRTILSSRKLDWWAVKYRNKLRDALTHAWGREKTTVIRTILSRGSKTWTAKEKRILKDSIDRYHQGKLSEVYEYVCFVLGGTRAWRTPLLRAREAAKKDLKEGSRLPKEVLEGLRSTYHKDVVKDEVLKLAVKEGTLGKKEKMLVQRQAKEAGVKVKMDPMDYDAIRLYLYGFEMGMTGAIEKALMEKAKKAAKAFPTRYERVGVLIDASRSMSGDKTQPMRPLAAVLAMRDMLTYTATNSTVRLCGGEFDGVWKPSGDTDLATGLLELLADGPDTIFVLSDGYENRPAGRFAEVLGQAREIGIDTPVYHINPVFAAEVGSVRELAPELVSTMPVRDPASIGLSFLRGMLEADPVRGINVLIGKALPVLGSHNESSLSERRDGRGGA
jgi:hypothetical protein